MEQSKKEMDELFAAADSNNDGKLDEAEFTVFC